MASRISEESLELEIGLCEALPPSSESYPYPALEALDRVERRAFPVVVLENEYLRATFAPSLGGRLLALLDKRLGAEVWGAGPLRPQPGGRRGATLAAGMELHLTGEPRLTAMAPVAFAAQEDEAGAAVVWFAEAVTGTGLSWHWRVELAPETAALKMEARILNRTDAPVPYQGGLLVPGRTVASGPGFVGGEGWVLATGEWPWRLGQSGDRIKVTRFESPRELAPRQVDTWRVSLIPSALSPTAVGEDLLVAVDGAQVRIQAASALPNVKIFLQCHGRILEATAELAPGAVWEGEAPEPPDGVVIKSDGAEILRWDSSSEGAPDPLWADTFDAGRRHAAYARFADRAIRREAWNEAGDYLEQSLLTNGDDPLAWWLAGVVRRRTGNSASEAPELLNAHFLAPLEPALRAESFLAQPVVEGREPSPLLNSLTPEDFVEVACLLLDRGLWQEGVRWLDEALRREKAPILLYLLAYAYLSSGKMGIEASAMIARAGEGPVQPPYPWRPFERRALTELKGAFPTDGRLAEYANFAIKAGSG